jgi:hypothetical protein
MGNKYFVRFIESSPEFYSLIKQRPTAFALLAIIVDRARKVPLTIKDGIEVGEALIGDYEKYGATEQTYKTDKNYLKKFGITTFKSTSKGTIAKLVNSSIFDISRNLSTDKSTGEQQATNEQPTTKQEVRSKKEETSQAKPMEKNAFFHDRHTETLLNETNQSLNEDAHSAYKDNNTSDDEKRELYWNTHAPSLAREIDIQEESLQYLNAKKDWMKKVKVPSPGSIKAFLNHANEWDETDKVRY